MFMIYYFHQYGKEDEENAKSSVHFLHDVVYFGRRKVFGACSGASITNYHKDQR